MSGEARKLLKAVLKLPAGERAAFAGSLIRSLEGKADPDVDAAWAEEITRRVKDLEAGRTKLIPWSEVRKKLYRKLPSARHGAR